MGQSWQLCIVEQRPAMSIVSAVYHVLMLTPDSQTMYSARVRKVVSLFEIRPVGCSSQRMAAENETNGMSVDAATQLVRTYSLALLNLRYARLPDVRR